MTETERFLKTSTPVYTANLSVVSLRADEIGVAIRVFRASDFSVIWFDLPDLHLKGSLAKGSCQRS